MEPIIKLTTLAGLLSPSLGLAHGMHSAAPPESLLHLLAHNWPLLLLGVAVAGGIAVLRKSH